MLSKLNEISRKISVVENVAKVAGHQLVVKHFRENVLGYTLKGIYASSSLLQTGKELSSLSITSSYYWCNSLNTPNNSHDDCRFVFSRRFATVFLLSPNVVTTIVASFSHDDCHFVFSRRFATVFFAILKCYIIHYSKCSNCFLSQCFPLLLRHRSSHRRCSVRKGVLRNFAKFTGKHLCVSLFFDKVAGLGHPWATASEGSTVRVKLLILLKNYHHL